MTKKHEDKRAKGVSGRARNDIDQLIPFFLLQSTVALSAFCEAFIFQYVLLFESLTYPSLCRLHYPHMDHSC